VRLLQELVSQDGERAPATRQPRPSPAAGIGAQGPKQTASPTDREPHPAQRKGTASRDLTLILALAVVSFVLAVSLDLFETLHELARRWNVEEGFVIAIVLAIAFGGFYFLRWRELHLEIQQREQAHQALRENERRLQLIARASNDALWDWDMASGQVWLDEGYRTLFGHSVADNIVAVSWWSEKIHAEDRQRVLDGIEQVFSRREHFWTGEYRFLHANGTYVDVLDRGYVHYDTEGKPVRMVGAMMDLAERKRAEQALRESERHFHTLAEIVPVGELEPESIVTPHLYVDYLVARS